MKVLLVVLLCKLGCISAIVEERACFAGSGVDFEASDIELEHVPHITEKVVRLFI